jgi:hypothetical protein
MKRGNRLIPLVLLALLLACTGGSGDGEGTDALLPDRIHGTDLVESLSGEEAAGMIARLHGKGVAPVESEIGFYGAFRPPLTLYVSVFASAEEARDQMSLMVEAIGQGSSGFTDPRSERVEGVDVEFVVGHGQAHYYFAEGDRLLWLAAPAEIVRPALLDLLGE